MNIGLAYIPACQNINVSIFGIYFLILLNCHSETSHPIGMQLGFGSRLRRVWDLTLGGAGLHPGICLPVWKSASWRSVWRSPPEKSHAITLHAMLHSEGKREGQDIPLLPRNPSSSRTPLERDGRVEEAKPKPETPASRGFPTSKGKPQLDAGWLSLIFDA